MGQGLSPPSPPPILPGTPWGGGAAVAVAGTSLLVGLFVWLAWERPPPLDDSFITYRYARNLAEGHGLVYNVGEYVEGFTTPLWALVLAAAVALGVEAPTAGHALGVVSGVLGLVACAALAAAGLEGRARSLAPLAPAVLVAVSSYTRWGTSGMETLLFAAATCAAFAALAVRRIDVAALALVVATFTRPEGVLVAACALVLAPFTSGVSVGATLRAGAGYAAFLVVATGVRFAYYGAFLPNTFYAKVGAGEPLNGLVQVAVFLAQVAGLLAVPVAFAAYSDRRSWPATACSLGFCAYLVVIGGGTFKHRMLLPILPLLAAIAVWGVYAAWRRSPTLGAIAASFPVASVLQGVFGSLVSGLVLIATTAAVAAAASRWGRRGAIGAFAVSICMTATGLAGHPSFELAQLTAALRQPSWVGELAQPRLHDRRFERLGKHAARVLGRRGEGDALVAIGAIGSFGYYSRNPVLDIFGLVDATIARSERKATRPTWPPGHQRSDADYVMSRQPDYILIAKTPSHIDPTRAPVWAPAIGELWRHPDLARHYRWDAEIRGYRRAPRSDRPDRG